MYEILEVPPTASLAEIKAAHKRMALKIMSGASGLSREDCEFNLQLLDVALHTLVVPALRDAYDAELAVTPANMPVPYKPNIVSIEGGESTALQMVAGLEDSRRMAAASLEGYQPQLKVVSSVVNSSVKSLKTLMRILISLAILGSVLQMAQCGLAARQAGRIPPEEKLAEDKVIIQEYYQIHGVRPASRAEAERLMQEHQREKNVQREAGFKEEQKARENQYLAEAARREGENIHDNLVRAEMEQERQKQREAQEWENKQRQIEQQRLYAAGQLNQEGSPEEEPYPGQDGQYEEQ